MENSLVASTIIIVILVSGVAGYVAGRVGIVITTLFHGYLVLYTNLHHRDYKHDLNFYHVHEYWRAWLSSFPQ